MGYASGVLLQEPIHTLEDEFLQMIHGYVPEDWKLSLIKSYVIYRNRHLTEHVPADYRMEIFGGTVGCPDLHPELGPYYNRLLNYHAAHDVSYLLIDNPLITRAGCTAFGAWGKSTTNGHLITGRNFDWEAAEVFSRDRVVILREPDGAIPSISLAWAGMVGVVSGMNRAGISITVNGAPSRLPGNTATPVALVARDVLDHAHDLREALERLRAARVFVSTLCLLGSRADGKFVVVEKTPDSTEVREAEEDSILCANHFQTTGLKDDDRNREYIGESTSASRAQRMAELMQEAHGTLNAPRAVEILRDRNLPGGAFAGNGHRATLNAFIATHATVMDLTEGIFWAASPPNQLGRFVAFDVHDFDHELPERTVVADPVLASGEYENTRKAQLSLRTGQQALDAGEASSALASATQAEMLNPVFYQNATLQGRALLTLGRKDEAIQALKTALRGQPAFSSERQQLEALLKQAEGVN